MSDQDIDTQEHTKPEEETEANTYESLLKEITDQDGRPKYASIEDALKANKHAQEHITTLEQENKRFEEENSRMEELLKQLSGKKEESQATTEEESATTDTTESPKPSDGAPKEETVTSKEELFAEWEQRLSEKQKQEREQRNKEAAVERLQSVYADKSADALKSKAEEMGVEPEYLLSMAATSPKLFDTTMGLSHKQKPNSDWSSSSVNSSSLADTQTKPKPSGNPLRSTRAGIEFWEHNC